MSSLYSHEKEKSARDSYLEYSGKAKHELEALKKIYENKVEIERKISIVTWMSEKTGKDVEKIIIKYVPRTFLISMLVLIFYIIFVFLINFDWFNFSDNPVASGVILSIIFLFLVVSGMILDYLKPSSNQRELRIINEVLANKYLDGDKLITPKNPFSNEQHYIETINLCERYIHILDKYFNEKGLELLSKGISPNIKEIKILTQKSEKVDKLKKSFKKLKTELKNRGIFIELKVLKNKKLLDEIHNRFLFSAGACYDIPSPDTVSRGQLSTISRINGNQINFEKYWREGLDILKN